MHTPNLTANASHQCHVSLSQIRYLGISVVLTASYLTPFNRPTANDLEWRTHIRSLTRREKEDKEVSKPSIQHRAKKEEISGFMNAPCSCRVMVMWS